MAADAPEGRAFYDPPVPLPPGAPGEVVWAAPLDDPPEGSRGWRILYHSHSIHSTDVAVSGVVIVPDRDPPPGGFPVVSWAHGTTGAADACAPSRLRNGEPPLVDELLAAGYAVAATDYEGLGTPGPHPYLVGLSEGRSVLDAARAAARLEGVDVSNRVLVWGHSQGGHAALFAGELAPIYAPELDVVGVVSGAPVSDLASLLATDADLPGYDALVVTTAYAWATVHAGASLSDVLSEAAIGQLDAVEEECLFGVSARLDEPLSQLRSGDPMLVDPWPRLIEENTPGQAPIAAPVLLLQGGLDALILPEMTAAVADRLCRHRSGAVELRTYPGANHTSVVVAAQADMFGWMAARFAGEQAPSTCDA